MIAAAADEAGAGRAPGAEVSAAAIAAIASSDHQRVVVRAADEVDEDEGLSATNATAVAGSTPRSSRAGRPARRSPAIESPASELQRPERRGDAERAERIAASVNSGP